jgi:hypothetical protein
MKTTSIIRWITTGLLLGSLIGCQSMGSRSTKPKQCKDCNNGTCPKHTVGVESHDPIISPGPAPFPPYSAGK